jgi:hypothetical protein
MFQDILFVVAIVGTYVLLFGGVLLIIWMARDSAGARMALKQWAETNHLVLVESKPRLLRVGPYLFRPRVSWHRFYRIVVRDGSGRERSGFVRVCPKGILSKGWVDVIWDREFDDAPEVDVPDVDDVQP